MGQNEKHCLFSIYLRAALSPPSAMGLSRQVRILGAGALGAAVLIFSAAIANSRSTSRAELFANFVAPAQPTDLAQLVSDPTRYTAILPGECSLQIDRTEIGCQPNLIHILYRNGRVVFNFVMEDDSILSFRGLSDDQPDPQEYSLIVNEVEAILSEDGSGLIPVEGECSLQGDPMTDAFVLCRAVNEDGFEAVGEFQQTGQPELRGPE
jgi:hypothetical protein